MNVYINIYLFNIKKEWACYDNRNALVMIKIYFQFNTTVFKITI